MKTLPYDVSRCSGRFDLNPNGLWCGERKTCQRYLALTEWDKKAGIPDYMDISVAMAIPFCKMKIEVRK